jgi:hypothetical protein
MKTELSTFSSFAKMPRKITSYNETNYVVTYSRVSTKEQHDKNLSLETQQKAFEEHARRNGKTILASFGGTYESAKTDGRKEFQRMLAYIKKSHRKISQIWVYMTDRFSRTGGGAIEHLNPVAAPLAHIHQSIWGDVHAVEGGYECLQVRRRRPRFPIVGWHPIIADFAQRHAVAAPAAFERSGVHVVDHHAFLVDDVHLVSVLV